MAPQAEIRRCVALVNAHISAYMLRFPNRHAPWLTAPYLRFFYGRVFCGNLEINSQINRDAADTAIDKLSVLTPTPLLPHITPQPTPYPGVYLLEHRRCFRIAKTTVKRDLPRVRWVSSRTLSLNLTSALALTVRRFGRLPVKLNPRKLRRHGRLLHSWPCLPKASVCAPGTV